MDIINTYNKRSKNLSVGDFIRLLLDLNVFNEKLSPSEKNRISMLQAKIGLRSIIIITSMSLALTSIITLFVYFNSTEQRYLYYWISFISIGYIYSFINIYSNIRRQHTLTVTQLINSNYLVCFINGTAWGCLPLLLNSTYQFDFFIGEIIFMLVMLPSTAWAFPIARLTLLLLSTQFISYTIVNFYILDKGFYFPYSALLAFLHGDMHFLYY